MIVAVVAVIIRHSYYIDSRVGCASKNIDHMVARLALALAWPADDEDAVIRAHHRDNLDLRS